MTDSTANQDTRTGWKKSVLISVIILLIAVAATIIIFSTEPVAQRSAATRETAMLVDVIPVNRGNYRPTIVAMGTVEPAMDVILRSRVSGEIIEQAANFTPGGFVSKGEVLLRLDPSDYENALRQRRSELSQVRADLAIEMGRQDVARRDYQMLDEEIDVANDALVLREPQLQAIQAQVAAAEATVAQAELDLERTRVRAPFDARVLARTVNIGSQVSAGDDLARLVGLDEYWVSASVPLSKLRWLIFADEDPDGGSEVQVRNATAWPEGIHRSGFLQALVGDLETGTRMAEVLVTIPDPLARDTSDRDTPPLIIGAFLEARIEGREIADVVRLERAYVRQGDTVWVMNEEGLLSIREVEILFRDAEHAYIPSGLEDGELVVTTSLATVVDGAPLRVEAAGDEAEVQEQPAEETATP